MSSGGIVGIERMKWEWVGACAFPAGGSTEMPVKCGKAAAEEMRTAACAVNTFCPSNYFSSDN